MNKKYIPANDSHFWKWVKNLYIESVNGFVQWKIAAPELFLEAPMNDFETKLAKMSDPNRGKIDTLEKNVARKKLEKACREYVQGFLARNPLVTDVDRERLGISVYDTIPTTVSIPKVRAMVKVAYNGAGHLELHVAPEADISEDRRAYYGCKIQFHLFHADAPPPPDNRDALNRSVFTRRKKEPLVFQPEDSAKRMYFCARYENSKGQAGPWSNIMSAVIP
jgi:hypothetical protein